MQSPTSASMRQEDSEYVPILGSTMLFDFPKDPINYKCPRCKQTTQTKTNKTFGATALAFLSCTFCCCGCLCMNYFKDTEHKCGNASCGMVLGKHRPLSSWFVKQM